MKKASSEQIQEIKNLLDEGFVSSSHSDYLIQRLKVEREMKESYLPFSTNSLQFHSTRKVSRVTEEMCQESKYICKVCMVGTIINKTISPESNVFIYTQEKQKELYKDIVSSFSKNPDKICFKSIEQVKLFAIENPDLFISGVSNRFFLKRQEDGALIVLEIEKDRLDKLFSEKRDYYDGYLGSIAYSLKRKKFSLTNISRSGDKVDLDRVNFIIPYTKNLEL